MEKKRIVLYVFILFGTLTVIFLPGFSELEKMREENRQLRKRMEVLVKQNAMLGNEIKMMQEDPSYLEKKARGKLGIVKKGEVIYSGSGK